MKLAELAERLDCQLEGDPERTITGIAGLEEAGPQDLSFVTDGRKAGLTATTRAAALLVSTRFRAPEEAGAAWLRCERPDLVMIEAVRLLRPSPRPAPGIDASARIHPTAVLGRDCWVGAFVAIGAGCRIGDGAVIHPHVVLYDRVEAGERLTAHAHVVIREGTRLGHDVTLQPGVVVGGDGFGFVRREDGSYAKVPQMGAVEIDDGVEIQANSCIDRGTLSATRVGRGTKIDNLVQVAHNCQIAADVLLCAQVGLAGSMSIDEGAILAGQVGVAGHCRIGKGTIITAQSGTHGDLGAGKMYSGSPAFEHAQWLRSSAVFARLGELQRQVRELREQLRSERNAPRPAGS